MNMGQPLTLGAGPGSWGSRGCPGCLAVAAKKAVEKAANRKNPLNTPNSMIGQFTAVLGTAVLGTAFLG